MCSHAGHCHPGSARALIYLLKTKPDFKTIAVVNQDYAWGRDSWAIFSQALKVLKPDVKVVAEFFPKFGAADFSTEVSRLLALKPDVILPPPGAAIRHLRAAGQPARPVQAVAVRAAAGRKLPPAPRHGPAGRRHRGRARRSLLPASRAGE